MVVGRLVAAPVVDTNRIIELASLINSTMGNLWVTVRCWTARVLPRGRILSDADRRYPPFALCQRNDQPPLATWHPTVFVLLLEFRANYIPVSSTQSPFFLRDEGICG